MLVYSPGAKDDFYTGEAFSLIASVISNVVTTTVEEFPYYYIRSYEGASVFNVLSALAASTSSSTSTIQGRNIVLLEDLTLENDIVFEQKVGLDLNGHEIDFNGCKVIVRDDSGSITNFFHDCMITDSKGIYNAIDSTNVNNSVDSDAITLDLDYNVMRINSQLSNYVTVSNYSLDDLQRVIQKRLNSYKDETNVSTSGSLSINLFDNYSYLLSHMSITNLTAGSIGETSSITNGVLTISDIDYTDVINVMLTVDNNCSRY